MASYRVELTTVQYVDIEACDPDDAQKKVEAAMDGALMKWDVRSVTRLSTLSTPTVKGNGGTVLRQGFSGI